MFLICLIMYLDFVSRKTTAGNSSISTEDGYFKTEITPLCDADSGKLVITGYIVKFSEIVKPDGTFDIQCGNNSNISTVYIFAKEKVLIDQNIYASGFDVFILAPTWEVVTVSVIRLNGIEGEHMPTPGVIGPGWDGVDGSPGNPGNPGGNFFGMGETFIDGKYLTIDVSGGDGGNGQDGGAGGPGTAGQYALKANLSLTCSHSACDDSGTQQIPLVDSAGNYTDFKCKEEYNYIIYDMFFLPPVSGNVRECSYYIYGSAGAVAGAGGDGGVGGKGGYPGQIFLLELFQCSEISKVNSSGKTGRDGKGAQGGEWAYTGWDVSFKKRETYSLEEPHISGTPVIEYIDSHRLVKLDKTLGDDGGNSRFIKEPVRREFVGLPNLYNAMKEYTTFVSNHSKN